MMMVGVRPSFMCIMGPYFWDNFWRFLCGSFPSKWRLPKIGNPFGPGGNIWFLSSHEWEIRARMSIEKNGRNQIQGMASFWTWGVEGRGFWLLDMLIRSNLVVYNLWWG